LKKEQIRINAQIRVSELRVLTDTGENLGVMSSDEALKIAKERGLDLIEVSPRAKPPIAKITDYGKHQYDQKKKDRDIKAKAHTTETKIIQVKIGTSEHDLSLKAKRISEWLSEGHRVKVDLFLAGRAKYTKEDFKKERLERILHLIAVDYKVAEEPKKSPKGFTIVIERAKGVKKKEEDAPKPQASIKEEEDKTLKNESR